MIAPAVLLRAEAWPVLLAAPLVATLLWALARRRTRRLRAWVGPRTDDVVEGGREGRRQLKDAAFVVGLLLGLVALLGPAFGAPATAATWQGADVVLALDVSHSMQARDLTPTRLARAQREIRALVDRAAGNRMALVVFAGEARLAVPLTEDLASLADLADLADATAVGRGGTDLGAALDVAATALEGSDRPGVVVLLTDGEDHEGHGLLRAGAMRDGDVPVHTIGLGSPRGSKITVEKGRTFAFLTDRAGRDVVSALDREGLTRIASATGGTYVEASAAAEVLVPLYDNRILPAARASSAQHDDARPGDRYQGFLAAALILWLLALGVPVASRRAVVPLLLLVVVAGCGGEARDAYDEALAALTDGDLEAADAAAERAAGGDDDVAPYGAFLRGNVAFAKAMLIAEEAKKPDADPRLRAPAIAYAENALAFWRTAATSRSDWPEARRNVERALLLLESLRERRSENDPQRRPPPGSQDGTPEEAPPAPPPPPEPTPPPPIPGPGPEDDGPEEVPTTVETTELPAADVLRLLDLLERKEGEKQAVRRVRQRRRSGDVERDW